MANYRIAEAAQIVGVPATTLRYYEDIGLVAEPERGPNGYRSYDDRDLDRLRFITRAKTLNLTLDDLRDLVEAWEFDDCGAVQERLKDVLASRLAETRARVADLTELAAQMQAVADRLDRGTTDGPCSPGCPCGSPPGSPRVLRPSRKAPSDQR